MAEKTAKKTVRAIIFGRVQGVFYRTWTQDNARARGLDGWVRNRRDGTVEAVFSGPREAVEDMLAACWNGPRAASVDNIALDEVPVPHEHGFHQRPTV